MSGKNNNNPLAAYIIAGHLAFAVAMPLVVFIWGGTWLVDRMNWNESLKIVCVILGILSMVASLISYLRNLIKTYGDGGNPKPQIRNEKDYDYYYENNLTPTKSKDSKENVQENQKNKRR
ncbi:MAG: AtpZ/AtpI family protein [Oscillospiraceae bacterium]|jgi:hypothetical protein|nr:AtpZ/AtpI family protein [Oscillospiraceae bacterium]